MTLLAGTAWASVLPDRSDIALWGVIRHPGHDVWIYSIVSCQVKEMRVIFITATIHTNMAINSEREQEKSGRIER